LLQLLVSKDFTTSCLDRVVVTAAVEVRSSLFATLLCLLYASLVVHIPLFLCCRIGPIVVYFCLTVLPLAICRSEVVHCFFFTFFYFVPCCLASPFFCTFKKMLFWVS
jgi:hypothetical protein